jgi:hypothetical protein
MAGSSRYTAVLMPMFCIQLVTRHFAEPGGGGPVSRTPQHALTMSGRVIRLPTGPTSNKIGPTEQINAAVPDCLVGNPEYATIV